MKMRLGVPFAALLGLGACGDDSAGSGSADGTDTDTDTGSTGTSPTQTTTATMTTADSLSMSGDTGTTTTVDTTATGDDSGSESSSTGPGCVDADGDGVTDCDGDCDDDEPAAFPGNPEICGDGIDNDCANGVDDACGDLGTYVSALTGDDLTGDGTQADPVRTIFAGQANATAIGNGQPVFVAEGVYNEKVIMVAGTDLLGGHHCDAVDCDWSRDPSVYRSTILNTDNEGVFADISLTRSTTIDGFSIVGLDDNNDSFGMTVDQGTPTIANNRIYGPDLNCSGCATAALQIFGPANAGAGALVENNELYSGDNAQSGASALRLRFPVVTVEVNSNLIQGGSARFTRAVDAYPADTGTIFFDNEINAGSQIGNSQGSSFAMVVSMGDLTIDSNRINVDPVLVGSCPSPSFWCGGIESVGAIATITNNVIFGMPAPESAAIYYSDGEVPFGELVINSNTLDGGSTGSFANGVSAAIVCRNSGNTGPNAQVGRIRNNIQLGGGALNRFGYYEENQASNNTCEPQVYENNDLTFMPSAISVDNAHRQWQPGGPELLHQTAADVNANLGYAMDNFDDDPLLDFTFHLGPGSPCIDAGVGTDAPSEDFEGDTRPMGVDVDVGADERE